MFSPDIAGQTDASVQPRISSFTMANKVRKNRVATDFVRSLACFRLPRLASYGSPDKRVLICARTYVSNDSLASLYSASRPLPPSSSHANVSFLPSRESLFFFVRRCFALFTDSPLPRVPASYLAGARANVSLQNRISFLDSASPGRDSFDSALFHTL